jgi:hypothetical protein
VNHYSAADSKVWSGLRFAPIVAHKNGSDRSLASCSTSGITKFYGLAARVFLLVIFFGTARTHAGYEEIVPREGTYDGSGKGTLDFILFNKGGAGVNSNVDGDYNFDNANTDISGTQYSGSVATSGAELKAFYTLNFGFVPNQEIVIFLDLNETGAAQDPRNLLSVMDVIRADEDTKNSLPDPIDNDLTSAQQNAIDPTSVSGTTLASLDPSMTPAVLPLVSQGAGFADYAIFTGINPYSLAEDDVVVFNQKLSGLTNGTETKFLIGDFSAGDILPPAVVIVPSSLALMGVGIFLLMNRNRSGARLRKN